MKLLGRKYRLVLVGNKRRKTRLRWFGRIKRMCINEPVRKCEGITFLDIKGVEEDKKNWYELIRQDMRHLILMEYMAEIKSFLEVKHYGGKS